MDILKELLKKETIDTVLLLGVIIIGVILILAMLMVFLKVARVEKIGVGGIECDPEDEKPSVKKTTRRRVK